MNRRDLITLAGAGALTAALPRAARAQSGSLETIRLAAIPSDGMTPLYYGIRTGVFARAGIDLQVIPASSGSAATTAVIAGAYEIANTSLLPALTAYLKDIPIRIVAPQGLYTPDNPFALLQIAADSPCKTGADLNGKTIAVGALNDVAQLSISVWVDQHGGDSKTLKFVEIPAVATDEALVQHRVDAALLFEPVRDVSLAAGRTKTLGDAYGAIAPKWMFAAYISRTDWAQAHSDLLRRFVVAAGQVAAYTNVHTAETAPMMAEITQIPLPIMQKMKRVACATSLDPGLVQPFIDVAAKYHNIPRGFGARDIFWLG
jgi:NitT/TauT family transport system substrate-binding protein